MKAITIRHFNDKAIAKSYIDALPEGKIYEVVVKQRRTRRTLPQNSLLHMWFKCVEDETGTRAEDVKEYCKAYFLGTCERSVFGKTMRSAISTSTLDTIQMTHFMKNVQAWAASELGIVLPLPEDLYFEQFIEHYR